MLSAAPLRGPIALLVALVAVGLALPVGAAAGPTDWLGLRYMNIAHQGGEDEAPSNAMYAYARAMRLGADMLEVDIHTSADGEVMVLHDGTVDRTTNGSGSVYEMTAAEIQALDAAHNFVPGVGTTSDAPESDYVFRGIRTGERKPPPAFKARDFRIPTLDEVMTKYPTVPINIEIKGASDEDVESFMGNAEALAAYLNDLGRTEGIIVASFNDAALAHFHSLAPEIDLAAATAAVAAYKAGGVPPPDGTVAFQVPITFGGVEVTNEQFVQDAHADGLAVHVWTINDAEEMKMLLDWDADGIMTAVPTRLEKVLCNAGVERPPRPKSFGGKHCSKKASIACDVKPLGAKLAGKGLAQPRGRGDAAARRPKLAVTLRRGDEFEGRCAGRVNLRVRGTRGRSHGSFNLGDVAPSEGGPSEKTIKIKPTRKQARALGSGAKLKLAARPYGAFAGRARLTLG